MAHFLKKPRNRLALGSYSNTTAPKAQRIRLHLPPSSPSSNPNWCNIIIEMFKNKNTQK